ncbi:aldehyde reductase [Pelagibacterium flavum]|uniref:Aldehyde reductase n=1 Tax=Pelagibacterium flavum TaxID=2984530 RepID=A0ABY6ILI4_9HYPH|nr:aldehyde reductase [Pelagibacterium sp. YIM 151497]UYQ71438.1 aldehyde reductase [Pelagibacterium sp. YIM 151497]|tara:strand:- start:2167 stop:3189 length:1023 start_codon:yes stop_codon:yes gene_type:complete
MTDRVLLTGISGFLGGHVALQLLNAGYTVRGSVRNLSRADSVKAMLANAGADIANLEFVALDLESDDGWQAAMDGVRFLQHTASPFVLRMPEDKNDLIRPAVRGTERALNAALAADVERIVLTSSMAAIAYGHEKARTAPFTANDWTNLEGRGVTPYIESKTLAERRAWEIMRAADRERDLATINPSGIFGPLLNEDPGTSVTLVQRLMNGSVPASPRIPLVAVDVRDVAQAHLAAMVSPEAGGHRFPMGERTMFFAEVATLLRHAFPDYAKKIPRRELPDWAVRLYALFDRDVRSNLGELGVIKRLDSSSVVRLLDRKLTPAEKSFVATGESLIAQGLV